MAMEMQRTLKDMQHHWHHHGLQEPLEMRIGIATGFATVGNFGSDLRLEYTAVGSGVNTASRLETAADNGDILMSFDTYSLVSDRIPCQEGETIHAKGLGMVRTFRPVSDDADLSSRLSLEIGDSMVNTDISQLTPAQLEAARASLEEAVDKLNLKIKEESAQESLL
jgi:class 3 adenylate cyclase